MKVKKILLSLLVLGVILLLFFKAEYVSAGVRKGLTLCGEVVIPSLFPFTIICNFITLSGVGLIISKPIGRLFSFLFNIPRHLSFAVLLSFIGGYPVGATVINRLYEEGQVDKRTAQRLLCFSVNAGPAMIVFGVGGNMLFDIPRGFVLWGAHLLASGVMGVITGLFSKSDNKFNYVLCKPLSTQTALVQAVESGVKTILIICGFVVLFCSVSSFVPQKFALFLEVTAGCRQLVDAGKGMVEIAFLLGFSGISVLCQVLAVADKVCKFLPLLLSRIAHGVLSAVFIKAFCLISDQSAQVITNGVDGVAKPFVFSVPFTLSLIIMAVAFLAVTKKN